MLLVLTLIALTVSGWQPYDRATWLMEVFPVLLGLPVLLATHRSFPLTPLLYRLLFVHGLILVLGGHYSYARVPLGFWMQDVFGFARNHYDRLGHLAQGWIPAILVREVLIRTSPLRRGAWLGFVVICVCVSISALYEMIEWWAALLGEEAADAFLGTQGDPWDTQWDMFLALVGAILSLAVLRRAHDRQLARLLPQQRQA